MDSLDEVARTVRSCTDCPLHTGRTNAVPGEGNPQADVMFIGEGPGFHEDRQGRPFVGPAGQLLEGLLASIGTNRSEVFIANMVKCRPPDNRDPAPSEISACSKYLDRQIELLNPKLIVTLGRFSLGRFFPGESITRARGKVREKGGRLVFPVLHPAAALRRTELRSVLVEDFRSIANLLEHAERPSLNYPKPTGPAAGVAEAPEHQYPPGPAAEQLAFGAAPPAPAQEPAAAAVVSGGPSTEQRTEQLDEEPGPEQLILF